MTTVNNVIAFVQAHQVAMVGFGVALLDFLFAMSPRLQSNGVLHAIYTFLKPKAQ